MANDLSTLASTCLVLAGSGSHPVVDEVNGEILWEAVSDGWEAVNRARNLYGAALVELPLENWAGEAILDELLRADPGLPCIFLGPLAEAPKLVRLGAFACLPDTAPVAEIRNAVRQAMAQRTHTVAAAGQAEPWQKFLVGESAAMIAVRKTIQLIANRRSTVLITGETGTGKEMAARAVHAAGNRAHKPMVAVNCSALPENLLEAELFGHVRGAFTGAVQSRTGRFEQAHQGTIFLDEVAEMPLELQSKLLRVLQEREFQRLGSSETVKVDVRVIAACNVDLEERIRQGKFREDLYYRLNVVPIRMPALRDRSGDLTLLARHFLEKICALEEIPLKRVAPETLERLARYSWPGNVRQLENSIEMAVAMSGERSALYPSDFALPSLAPPRPMAQPLTALAAAASASPASATPMTLPEEGIDFEATVGTLERALLEQALLRTRGNKKLAAELLGLKRTTLTAKLKSLETRAVRAAGC
ncbi:MAG: sigma-54 dependent transcriptional regulator [Bryobacteraceae bacterium]